MQISSNILPVTDMDELFIATNIVVIPKTVIAMADPQQLDLDYLHAC